MTDRNQSQDSLRVGSLRLIRSEGEWTIVQARASPSSASGVHIACITERTKHPSDGADLRTIGNRPWEYDKQRTNNDIPFWEFAGIAMSFVRALMQLRADDS